MEMAATVVENAISMYTQGIEHPEEWNIGGIIEYLEGLFLPKGCVIISEEEVYDLTRESLKDRIIEVAEDAYRKLEEENGAENMREAERVLLLRVVDKKWMDHIDAMDQLRQGIGLRAYGHRDPVIEYQIEGYEMFEEMIRSIQEETISLLYHVRVQQNMPRRERVAEPINATHGEAVRKPIVKGEKVGRNDPCPCGSGKKYKKCCGRAG
jgi:preprotein translocase subunit SecA